MLLRNNTTGEIIIGENGYLENYEVEGYALNSLSFLKKEAICISNELYKFYKSFTVSVDDNVGFFLLGSLVRAHKDYQSALILISRGLQSQAKAIVRNLMEKVFYIKAVSENPDHLEYWISRQVGDRNTLRRVVMGGYACLTEEELEQIDLEIEDMPSKTLGIREWAVRADLVKDYEVIYRQLCFDTHHSGAAMTRDYVKNENGIYDAIDLHPHFDEIDPLVFLLVEYLSMAIKAIADYVHADCCWVDKYLAKLDEIADKSL